YAPLSSSRHPGHPSLFGLSSATDAPDFEGGHRPAGLREVRRARQGPWPRSGGLGCGRAGASRGGVPALAALLMFGRPIAPASISRQAHQEEDMFEVSSFKEGTL